MLYEVITNLIMHVAGNLRLGLKLNAFGALHVALNLAVYDHVRDCHVTDDLGVLTVITSYSIHYTKLYDNNRQDQLLIANH